MKKLFYFASIVCVTLLTSCSSDSDSNSASIVGKWEYLQEGIKVGDNENLMPYDHFNGSCGKDFLEFTSNNQLLHNEYDANCELNTYNDGTYTRSGNTISVNDGGEVVNATIKELTSTTLKYYVPSTDGTTAVTRVLVLQKKP
ncbi:lipocalin family protein [Flavobacterium sp.]|uniref:lipocalin family protein n=1 Tax=Flavobacterium sp. TaxID=239 RepID=UPI002489368A|nr:lipocalin family protein [Flavobacterium sp.]MDI1316648.1 lipocalin family protein [Flavobacterium sp.]